MGALCIAMLAVGLQAAAKEAERMREEREAQRRQYEEEQVRSLCLHSCLPSPGRCNMLVCM